MTWMSTVRRVLLSLACLALFGAPLLGGEAEAPKTDEGKKEEAPPLKPPDYSTPKATFQTLLEGAKAGSRERFLSCLDEASRKAMADLLKMIDDLSTEFPEMKQQLGEGDLFAKVAEEARKSKIETGEEKVTGDTATLEILRDGQKDTAHLVREKDAWKIKLTGEIPKPEDIKKHVEQMRTLMKAMKEQAKGEKAPAPK